MSAVEEGGGVGEGRKIVKKKKQNNKKQIDEARRVGGGLVGTSETNQGNRNRRNWLFLSVHFTKFLVEHHGIPLENDREVISLGERQSCLDSALLTYWLFGAGLVIGWVLTGLKAFEVEVKSN